MGPGPAPDAVFTAYVKYFIRRKAKQLCRKPGFNLSEEEDLAQDLTLFLWAKADQYDPSRGASPNTFANRVINSGAKMILRARGRIKCAAGFSALSLQSDCVEIDGKLVPLEEVAQGCDLERRGVAGPPDPIATLENREAIDLALNALDPAVADLARRTSEQTVNAMHEETGTSRRQLNNAIKLTRETFEDFGLGLD